MSVDAATEVVLASFPCCWPGLAEYTGVSLSRRSMRISTSDDAARSRPVSGRDAGRVGDRPVRSYRPPCQRPIQRAPPVALGVGRVELASCSSVGKAFVESLRFGLDLLVEAVGLGGSHGFAERCLDTVGVPGLGSCPHLDSM